MNKIRIGKILAALTTLGGLFVLMQAPASTCIGVLLMFIGKDMSEDMRRLEKEN